jgi:hypothetical protein
MSFIPSSAVPDETAFVAATTPVLPVGGVYDDTLGAVPTGDIAGFRITEKRAAHINLRSETGVELGTVANPLKVTPDSVALPANQSVNVNQIVGTAVDVNSGNKGAGTQRIVIATDQPTLTNPQPALEYVTTSGTVLNPRQRANRVATNFIGTSVAAVVTGAPGYFIESIQIQFSALDTQAGGGSFNIQFSDSVFGMIWGVLAVVPAAAPTLTGVIVIPAVETPPGYYWNNKNANSVLNMTFSASLSGSTSLFYSITYGICSFVG